MPIKSGSGDPADLIRMAIERIDDQIGELTTQRAQLVSMVSGGVAAATVVRRRGRPPAAKAAAPATRKKRKVSAATKAKLKAAAKARWARYRAERKSASA